MKSESKQQQRRVAKLARLAARLAKETVAVERAEEAQAQVITQEVAREQAFQPGQPSSGDDGLPAAAGAAAGTAGRLVPPRRALLVVNSKSGPNHDSILRVREIADLLAAHDLHVDVRVKLHKKQATKEARAAAQAGYGVVIAAGGDGTVEAVARGLAGTEAALGIIPLGTYNNVATSLGIPTDVAEACALIAAGVTRPVDVGEVRAAGRRKPRAFFEVAAVGLSGAIVPLGQDVEKGRWARATQKVPAALQMSPVVVSVRLDGAKPPHRARTLLLEVANAPRMGAGLPAAPDARMDDGLLDLTIYEDMGQAALAAQFVALKAGRTPEGPNVQRWRARRIKVSSDVPLPVVADTKVIGTTPATFKVRAGALSVIAGHGYGLVRPAPEALVEATAQLTLSAATASDDGAQRAPAPPGSQARARASLAGVAAPVAAGAAKVTALARTHALPVATGLGGAVAVSLLRILGHRGR